MHWRVPDVVQVPLKDPPHEESLWIPVGRHHAKVPLIIMGKLAGALELWLCCRSFPLSHQRLRDMRRTQLKSREVPAAQTSFKKFPPSRPLVCSSKRNTSKKYCKDYLRVESLQLCTPSKLLIHKLGHGSLRKLGMYSHPYRRLNTVQEDLTWNKDQYVKHQHQDFCVLTATVPCHGSKKKTQSWRILYSLGQMPFL